VRGVAVVGGSPRVPGRSPASGRRPDLIASSVTAAVAAIASQHICSLLATWAVSAMI
jgi:hypothetical protein